MSARRGRHSWRHHLVEGGEFRIAARCSRCGMVRRPIGNTGPRGGFRFRYSLGAFVVERAEGERVPACFGPGPRPKVTR